jgi:hypothetical protein
LFQAADIPVENRNITNHSGKVTCCTTLVNAGFSDSSVKSRSGHRSGTVETYKRLLEALHDSVSHALQPPKPTITACDTDNTATSVKEIYNDNKENCATDEDSACTMTLTVPNAIKKVVIFKNGKRYCLEI